MKHCFLLLRPGSRGRGETQHLVAASADWPTTSCVRGPQRAGGRKADPELTEIGSAEKERRIIAAESRKEADCCDLGIIAWSANFTAD